MAGIKVRRGVADDATALHALDLLCFDERFRFDRRTVRRYLADQQVLTLIAEDVPGVVGFLMLELKGACAYLVTLDVDPRLRRQGIAAYLMGEAEALARQAGSSTVLLHVWTENLPAMHFYVSRGFKVVRRVADYYGPALHAEVLEKKLA